VKHAKGWGSALSPKKTTRGHPAKKKRKPRNRFEANVARCLIKHGVTFEYEGEVLRFTVPEIQRKYTPDFKLDNGIYIESKGKFDREARQRMALVMEQHPDKDIRMLFMRDNPINKGSKTKYSDWCKQRNIKFAVSKDGEVPKEWAMRK
jgi:hypothetical protein